MARGNPVYYSVAPRYSGGSPGQVDEETARRVAKQEIDAHARALEGIYGDEKLTQARADDLEGIVYAHLEYGSGVLVHDLITDKRYRVPLKWWGAQGEERRSAHWYKRPDRAQFLLNEMDTTPFEQRGMRYEAHQNCMWCQGPTPTRPPLPDCSRCHGTGTETKLLKRGA